MSKVLTFSTHFPKTHPKAGEPTFFVEQIYHSIGLKIGHSYPGGEIPKAMWDKLNDFALMDDNKKHHTIRAGNRWKVGDKFSPRIWSGKPYASKQIEFAPPIEIKKIWTISKKPHKEHGFAFHINGSYYVADWEIETANIMLKDLARNDGLDKEDFINWFPESFEGQVLCWSESIDYLRSGGKVKNNRI